MATITNAIAISALVSFAKENGFEDAEVLAKAERHLATLTRPSKTEANREVLPKVIERLRESEDGCKASDLIGVCGIRNTSKAVAILRLGIEDGTVKAERNDKGVTYYKAA